ncbi:MAG: hypothetical protein MR750_08895 [Methanobrevibacter boviskoreani]|uniref:hypothetical protein n=1 Tax=Methanobrevibacter boviskoreani TaxID=1348249 RepID=UPI0005938B9A|nr:hypothetical protein [Methanobrevibacter boviskoreani]MCI6931352.1 hypothetical protein [Methanobrevibacter boviskoreani]
MNNDNLEAIWNNIPAGDYGDGKDVSCELLKREGQDIMWLYKMFKKLEKEGPVISTINFPYAAIDLQKSFGIQQEGKNWKLSDEVRQYKFNDFSTAEITDNTAIIDYVKTTAKLDYVEGICTIPVDVHTENNLTKYSWKDGKSYSPYLFSHRYGDVHYEGCNTFWNVSWNLHQAYAPHVEHLRNPLSGDVPATARAQTFVIPAGKITKPGGGSTFSKGETVYLSDISCRIQSHPNTGSPLYVEIRECEAQKANAKDKNKTWFPSGKLLARAEYRYEQKYTQSLRTFKFQQRIPLKVGYEYAIVLKSPLTCPDKKYGIGGWSTICHDNPYRWGNAFTSYNNGKTWQIYGKADKTLTHATGNRAPKDYFFELNIEYPSSKEYTIGKDYYIYFKPLQLNPTQVLQLSTSQKENDGTIKWEVSHDFKHWTQIGGSINGQDQKWTHECEGKQFVFIRAILTNPSNQITSNYIPPVIQEVEFNIFSKPAMKGYARTKALNPQVEPALGLNQWNNINAKVKQEINTKYDVDIISSGVERESFRIIDIDEIANYAFLITDENIKEEINTLQNNEEYKKIADIFAEHPEYVKLYQKNNIYILCDGLMPKIKYKDAGGSWNQRYYIPLKGQPAYPILSLHCLNNHVYNSTDEEFKKYAYIPCRPGGADGTEESYNKSNFILSNNEDTGDEKIKDSIVVTDDQEFTEWLEYTIQYNHDAENQPIFLHNIKYQTIDETEIIIPTTSDYIKCTDEPLKFEDCIIFENIEVTEDEYASDYTVAKADISSSSQEQTTNFDITKYTVAKPGIYEIEYNPIIVKNIHNEEMPFSLNYKTERFIITEDTISDDYNQAENIRRHQVTDKNNFILYMDPNCMIHHVYLQDIDNTDEVELTENIDYTVDYTSRRITLNDDLKIGDELQIEYIPNIRDTGLSLGYKLERTNINNNAYILPNGYSYRT